MDTFSNWGVTYVQNSDDNASLVLNQGGLPGDPLFGHSDTDSFGLFNLQANVSSLSDVTSPQIYEISYKGIPLNTPLFTNTYTYPAPTVTRISPLPVQAPASNQVPISILSAVAEALVSGATVSLYRDVNNSGYHGALIQSEPYTPVTKFTADMTNLGYQQYYFYFVIDDGMNSPVFSPYSTAIFPAPLVHGQVVNSNTGLPVAGLRVFLDQNDNGNFDPASEPSSITSSNGIYQIYASAPLAAVNVVLPSGFTLKSIDTSKALQGIVNITVLQLASITGRVEIDKQVDPTSPGVSGIQVFLDMNNNGQLDPGEPVVETDSQGNYTFANVSIPNNYTVHVVAQALRKGVFYSPASLLSLEALPPTVANQAAEIINPSNYGGTLGMEFEVTRPMAITQLGVYVGPGGLVALCTQPSSTP